MSNPGYCLVISLAATYARVRLLTFEAFSMAALRSCFRTADVLRVVMTTAGGAAGAAGCTSGTTAALEGVLRATFRKALVGGLSPPAAGMAGKYPCTEPAAPPRRPPSLAASAPPAALLGPAPRSAGAGISSGERSDGPCHNETHQTWQEVKTIEALQQLQCMGEEDRDEPFLAQAAWVTLSCKYGMVIIPPNPLP